MKRLLLVAAALAALALGLWLLAGPPRGYFLRQECARYHEMRKARFNQLRYDRARADIGTAAEIDRRLEVFLRETRAFAVRGWEVVLVPAGALPPGGYSLAVTCDPSVPADPAPLKGPMAAWVRPQGFLARLFG
ncbi:MAG: hypothetical protein L6Q95_10080 [Planctomycetes bacterium]|nr:hypothetical protein [Planctomycetota bacterium]